MKGFLFVLTILYSSYSFAQKIYGTVYNDKGDLMPYASVTIKGTSVGASANSSAKFSINVSPGTYIIVCQHIGYTRQEKKILVDKNDEQITFIMSQQKLLLKEVIIKSGGEDPAYAIIRQAIKKRPYYDKQVKGFECDLYTKDIIKIYNLPNKILGQKIPDEDRTLMGLDSLGQGVIYLSESIAKIHAQQPGKFKMEVKSSRVSGSGGFGFTFPAFISLYENNVTIFSSSLNPRGFISPIADGALSFYKYKFLGSFWEDGHEINSIKVIPRRLYLPLFSGVINISENDWHIHSLDLVLTRSSQLEMLDTLRLTQIHIPVGNDVWRVKNQLLHFNFKRLGIDAAGNFVNVYSNYFINPKFAKDLFNRVIIKYDTAVNKKTKAYWDTIRPVPLEPEEKKDYQVKDSIYELQKDTVMNQAAVDSINQLKGRIKIFSVLWSGIRRTHYSLSNHYSWTIEPLLQSLEYNPAEGLAINVNAGYSRYLKKLKTNLSISPNFRYGLSNTHFNVWADINLSTRDWEQDKKLKRESWTFSGGKRISQFNKDNPIDALTNSINVLFWGLNFMKTYENYFANINFSKRYESGFRFSINALYEDRIPLTNSTNFTVFESNTKFITPNYPYEIMPAQFKPHRAFIISADVSIKPGQRYIEFPSRKVAIGSKFPTISFNYTKGIENIFGSDVNFDKWRLTLTGSNNFKLAGELKYKIGMGGFLNTKRIFIQDYQHFNGNRSTGAVEYVNSFQLAPYYTFSNDASFYTFGFIEHHFNGLLTNQIPLFKKLNWNLVAGTNTFCNNNTTYVEVFAGLENIFKIFRIDLVNAYINGNKRISGFCIGTGGLIGGRMQANARNRNVSISF